MARFKPTILITTLVVGFSSGLDVSFECDSSTDRTAVGMCVRPWLDLWEIMRAQQVINDVHFPVLYYDRKTVNTLCEAYLKIRSSCLTDEVLKSCDADPMIGFLQSHMGYFCGTDAVFALSNWDCLSKSLQNMPSCRDHIRGVALPGQDSGKCNGIPAFFRCLQPEIAFHCGEGGLQVIENALTVFGCSLEETDEERALLLDFNTNIKALKCARHLFNGISVVSYDRRFHSKQDELDQASNTPSSAEKQLHRFDKPTNSANIVSTDNLELNDQQLPIAANRIADEIKTPPTLLQQADRQTEESREEEDSEEIDAPTKKQQPEITDNNINDLDASRRRQPLQERRSSSPSDTCPPNDFRRIIQCMGPMSQIWDEIHRRVPRLSEVYFPLFNYSTVDLLALCETLQTTLDTCLTADIVGRCGHLPIIQFVNSNLGFACGSRESDFFLTYDCTHKIAQSKPSCYNLIAGTNQPGIPESARCANMQSYYDCLHPTIAAQCSVDSVDMFTHAIRHYGCNVIEPSITIVRSSTTKERKTAAPLPVVQQSHKVTKRPVQLARRSQIDVPDRNIGDKQQRIDENEIQTQSPTPILSTSRCDDQSRQHARACLLPLMMKWTNIRQNAPALQQITFSTFLYDFVDSCTLWMEQQNNVDVKLAKPYCLTRPKLLNHLFSRSSLLDLCDGYANAFLCGGFEPFAACIDDDFVRFANAHLGYLCSPPNIGKFMVNFDCMHHVVRDTIECVRFVFGSNIPGADTRRCDGMVQFYACIQPAITAQCGLHAKTELEQTIRQFGCEFL